MDKRIDKVSITNWIMNALEAIGLETASAGIVAEALVQTSLWGIDSHGVARITHYLARFSSGSIATLPQWKFTQTAAAVGNLDGGDGHGIVLLHEATHFAIKIARESGIGVVGVSNSSHCGAIGLYTRKITESGMIGIAFTHSDALVVPHLGTKAFFGTNPISIAIPSLDPAKPICLDMATSIVPWNYIMNARRDKATLPPGLGVDHQGLDTQNPEEMVAVKPMAGHKGYAMAFMIDMLCGPLNGMNFGPHLTPMYQQLEEKRKLGSLVIAIDPQRFAGLEFLKMAAMAAIDQLKQQGTAVLFPGEPEYLKQEDRQRHGIPVPESLALEFTQWSQRLNVKNPVYL